MSSKPNDPEPASEQTPSQAPTTAVEDDSDPGYEDLDGTPQSNCHPHLSPTHTDHL